MYNNQYLFFYYLRDVLLTKFIMKKIALIGLGYVGLPLAVEFGKKRTVVGFDINQLRINDLENGVDSTLENTTEELNDAKHLSYTANLDDVKDCEIFIITVPTPIDKHKRPDLTPLEKSSEAVGSILKKGDIVIYESTVYPGCTEEDCAPVLERCSGLKYLCKNSFPATYQNVPT